jgi:hypothetical protein
MTEQWHAFGLIWVTSPSIALDGLRAAKNAMIITGKCLSCPSPLLYLSGLDIRQLRHARFFSKGLLRDHIKNQGLKNKCAHENWYIPSDSSKCLT